MGLRFGRMEALVGEVERQGEQKGSWMERFGVFGDLPTRLMHGGLLVAPWFLEPFLVGLWTMLFFVIAGEQRRAVQSNLAALLPGTGRAGNFFRAYRVFLEFALTYVDAIRCDKAGGAVNWTIDGIEHFKDLASRREGCLIMTAHMGNYDLAAPLFSGEFGRTVHTVRAPERNQQMQELREKDLRNLEEEHAGFRVHYNRPDSMLAVELTRVLSEGDVVAVQADRVVFDVSPVEVEIGGGWVMRLPRGPLVLAQATGVPCFPLFITRDGWRCYRVTVMPELRLPKRRRGKNDESLRVWADTLLGVVRDRWMEWFVFEPIFQKKEG